MATHQKLINKSASLDMLDHFMAPKPLFSVGQPESIKLALNIARRLGSLKAESMHAICD